MAKHTCKKLCKGWLKKGLCYLNVCVPEWFNLPHFIKLRLFVFVPISLDEVGRQTAVLPRINVNDRLHIICISPPKYI